MLINELFCTTISCHLNLLSFFISVPSFFQIPHSLSLDERNKRLFVADRENSRVLMFDADKGRILQDFNSFGERVFAAHYHREKGA